MNPDPEKPLDPRFLDCIHCGLCLSSCPTFTILGTEADSPRGRIYLMRALAEGRAEPTDALLSHLDACLGCRACETACPSGIHYGELLEETRAATEIHRSRPFLDRMGRAALLGTLTQPDRLAMMMRGAATLGGKNPQMPGFLVRLITGKPSPSMPLPSAPRLVRKSYPAVMKPKGEIRRRAGFLTGCVMSVLYEKTNDATIRSLLRNGVEVHIPGDQGCCGALHAHNGDLGTAREMARRNLNAFHRAHVDVIVTNSAGCGSVMKEYAHLLKDDPEYAKLAEEFSAKAKDVTEVLASLEDLTPFQETPVRAAYHDACHLAHGQGVRSQPRALLEKIPGLSLIPLTESDFCCGSAGIYNFTQPELAGKLLERKIENIEAAEPEWLIAGNPGCLMWIATGLSARKSGVQILHTIEALDRAWGGEATYPLD
jgi:glycolate oxidase iron-sulfur subunit